MTFLILRAAPGEAPGLTDQLADIRRCILAAFVAPRAARSLLNHRDIRAPAEYDRFARDGSSNASARPDARLAILATFMPLAYGLKVEDAVATGLQERGWRVAAIAPWRTLQWARAYHAALHERLCYSYEDYLRVTDRLAIKSSLAQWFGRDAAIDFAAAAQWKYEGVPVGVHALASLAAGTPDGRLAFDARTRGRLRRTLAQSMLWVRAAQRFVDAVRPNLIVANEKGFTGTCELYHVAIGRGIDFVQWTSCHEPNSLMLKRYSTDNAREHPFSIGPAVWARLSEVEWNEAYRAELLATIDRGYNGGAWFRYKRLTDGHYQAGRSDLTVKLGLDDAKPNAIIYSHILNDANLFYGKDLFPGGYEQWLVETVRAAERNPRVNWILKLHPANRVRNQRLGYVGEYGEVLALRRAFGTIPSFLRLVYPEETVSPLSFFQITDWGITVRGTVGLELPCLGVPVLTAGTGRYSNKGFTEDSDSIEQYLDRIREIDLIPRLAECQTRRAITYALAVFRGRPARFGDVFRDTYPSADSVDLGRDLAVVESVADLREAIQTPQWWRIVDFIADGSAEDFFDATYLDSPATLRPVDV